MMMMTPAARRFVLTSHLTCSIGWAGAAIVFLALAVLGFTSHDGPTVRGVYLVMEPVAWIALVPLALASLVSGLVISLGTSWGLVRHYWVVLKLLITLFATIVLLIYMEKFRQMAGLAADLSVGLEVVRSPSPIVHAILALLLLLGATALAVYKPLGMTAYGKRRMENERNPSPRTAPRLTRPTCPASASRKPRWMIAAVILAIGALLAFLVKHLADGPFRHR